MNILKFLNYVIFGSAFLVELGLAIKLVIKIIDTIKSRKGKKV